jgi:hypothetical protein
VREGTCPRENSERMEKYEEMRFSNGGDRSGHSEESAWCLEGLSSQSSHSDNSFTEVHTYVGGFFVHSLSL